MPAFESPLPQGSKNETSKDADSESLVNRKNRITALKGTYGC
jgi:hypothetical protein